MIVITVIRNCWLSSLTLVYCCSYSRMLLNSLLNRYGYYILCRMSVSQTFLVNVSTVYISFDLLIEVFNTSVSRLHYFIVVHEHMLLHSVLNRYSYYIFVLNVSLSNIFSQRIDCLYICWFIAWTFQHKCITLAVVLDACLNFVWMQYISLYCFVLIIYLSRLLLFQQLLFSQRMNY